MEANDTKTGSSSDAETAGMAKPSRFSINDILHRENKTPDSTPNSVSVPLTIVLTGGI